MKEKYFRISCLLALVTIPIMGIMATRPYLTSCVEYFTGALFFSCGVVLTLLFIVSLVLLGMVVVLALFEFGVFAKKNQATGLKRRRSGAKKRTTGGNS